MTVAIDFLEGPYKDLAKPVIKTSVTKTISNLGSETLTEGGTGTIYGIFRYKNKEFIQTPEGLVEGPDAIFLATGTQDISMNDLIEFRNQKYRIRNIIVVPEPDTNTGTGFKRCELLLHER